MNIQESVNWAFEIIKEVKTKMILAGLGGEPEEIFAACKKLSSILNLPIELVADAFEVA